MLKNNNQIAVRRISRRSLKQNRTRNLFTVLAIILTTFMFTTVFGIGFSLVRNMKTMYLRQQGTKASITLARPSKEQKKQAEKAKNLHAAGIRIPAGEGTDITGEISILLNYYDEVEFQKNFLPAVSDLKGNYPKKEGEIMLSRAGLSEMGIKEPKIGTEVTLMVDSQQKIFRLCGWFTDFSYHAGFLGFVSKTYVDEMGLTEEGEGLLSLSAKPGKQSVLLQELEGMVKLEKDQKFEFSFDIQEENQDVEVVTAIAVILMGLIILSSGYLLIYNVMYISVTRDIRFYGMLKTIGTAPSQIKKIVKKQVVRLSLLGIPIGIILGTILSFAVVPYAMKMFAAGASAVSIMPSTISFNPFIYGGTVLFAIVTVAVSCRKPAKLASKVSPVEALKYNGQNQVKTRARKSTHGGKLYKMSFRNVFREKKRAILVFASLFMGTMAFLTVDTFLGSLKLENYVERYLPNDYTIYTNSNENYMDPDSEENTPEKKESYSQAVEQLVEELGKIDGITNLSLNRSADANIRFDEKLFMPFLKQEFPDAKSRQEAIDRYKNPSSKEEAYSAPVIAISTEMIDRYNQKARQKIDRERFEKGEVCLTGTLNEKSQSNAMRGKTITLEDKESKRTLDIEVGACMLPGEDYGINVGYSWMMPGAPDCILVSDAVLKRLCDTANVDSIIIDCDPQKESQVTAAIKNLVKANVAVLSTEIKSEQKEEFETSMSAMDVLGSGISFVLILIGVINFINVMLTGVFARKGELAVMESIGMTKKQIRRMLAYEGLYYGGITLLLILTLGSGIIYLIADMAAKIADYAVFHYPALKMFVISAVIMLICIIVPAAVYQPLSKESVTERLRNC